mgnify:CR=1 FL=1
MPDRYPLHLATALASNTGGPYTAVWDEAIVPEAGTLRAVVASTSSLASNARTNSVDIYLQPDAPAAGSNTATTVLIAPITLVNDNDAVEGSIRASNARVAVGERLQLRTYADNVGSQPAFLRLRATVLIERD